MTVRAAPIIATQQPDKLCCRQWWANQFSQRISGFQILFPKSENLFASSSSHPKTLFNRETSMVVGAHALINMINICFGSVVLKDWNCIVMKVLTPDLRCQYRRDNCHNFWILETEFCVMCAGWVCFRPNRCLEHRTSLQITTGNDGCRCQVSQQICSENVRRISYQWQVSTAGNLPTIFHRTALSIKWGHCHKHRFLHEVPHIRICMCQLISRS